MVINFLLLCQDCMRKYQSWEDSTLCNIHLNPDGTLVFTCAKCGTEEIFRPDRDTQPTAKEILLEREKMRIEAELKSNKL